MRKTVTIDNQVCDFCDSEDTVFDQCLRCGRDICYSCKKNEGVEYRHAVHFQGSGDGFYCNRCNEHFLRLEGTETDEKGVSLYRLYRHIENLRTEERDWYGDFNSRVDSAEKKLEELRKECGI